jgi:hypothetical protein
MRRHPRGCRRSVDRGTGELGIEPRKVTPGGRVPGRGFGTKIHFKRDLAGGPLDFHLTGNEASDSRQFETLLDLAPDVTRAG